MKISAIVPAYNEAERIGAVLEPLLAAPSVDEIVVVDDGSTDGTAEVAQRYGVKVVRLGENRGKGAAMAAGVREANGDTLLFLDADLTGLTPKHLEDLVNAYKAGDADMVIAVFRKGRPATDFSQRLVPFLSGQRIMPKRLWEKAEGLAKREQFRDRGGPHQTRLPRGMAAKDRGLGGRFPHPKGGEARLLVGLFGPP
jgi:glycosyltransferase involved in cell wall biosynthesis